MLEITPDVRTMIAERKDAQTIKSAAMKPGFKPLQKNAVDKILSGVTTVEEVIRVTLKDIEE